MSSIVGCWNMDIYKDNQIIKYYKKLEGLQ
jgi:hypothetical protein